MTTQQQEPDTQPTTPQFGDAGFKPAAHADDAELAELEAELAKASGANADGEAPPAEGEQQPEQDQQDEPPATTTEPAQGEAAPARGPGPMIPKSRLDQALRERDEMRERLARVEGMVVAMASGRQPPETGAPAPEPELTPEQRIEALKTDLDTLAETYEQGTIGTKDFVRQQTALQEQILDLRVGMHSARNAPQGDTYLQEQTSRLEDEFPVLKEIAADDVEAIVPLARREAVKQGIDISTDLRLRRHIASFAQSYYGKTQAPGGKPQGQGQPNPPLNPAANARAKLELARSAPPNLNTHAVAYSGTATGAPTPEQFSQMTDDQIAALPDAVLAKMANGR